MPAVPPAEDRELEPAVAPFPLDRWRRASRCVFALAPARRLALLDVLARRGPLSLAVASHEAGVGCTWAKQDAIGLERLGLIILKRVDGFNLGAVCEITPSGSRALELVGMWSD